MPDDPLLPLLATIERLDAAATKAPWRQHTDYPRVIVEAANPYESLLGLDSEDTAVVWKEADAQNIAFSRNTLAPLASMLRVAVEAMERYVTRCDVEGCEAWATWHSDYHGERLCDDHRGTTRHHLSPFVGDEQHEADARAALATIRRMAAETGGTT